MSDETQQVPDRSSRYKQMAIQCGLRIKLARSEAGWSQRELGERCGLDSGTISRLETGEIKEMSVGRFFDICEALALDPVFAWRGEKRRGAQRLSSTPPPASVERASTRPPKK